MNRHIPLPVRKFIGRSLLWLTLIAPVCVASDTVTPYYFSTLAGTSSIDSAAT